MHRQTKKQKLAAERAIRTENTSNGRRKVLYHLISVPSELINGDITHYQQIRAYLLNRNPQLRREDLPNNPTSSHYDLARRLLSE